MPIPSAMPSVTRVLSVDVGRKNLALCLLRAGAHPLGADDVIEEWRLLDIREPTAPGMRAALDGAGVDAWLRAGDVEMVIERQPHKNATMKRLEHYLEMFAAVHDARAVTIDPKHKLAFAANTAWWPARDALSGAWTYHKRKKLSAATAAEFLRAVPQPRAEAVFAATRKKDDLADCLLQGMAYAHHAAAAGAARAAAATGAPPARVVARRPSEARLRSYVLTKSGVKWLVRDALADFAGFAARLDGDARLASRVDKLFGDRDAAFAALRAK